MRKQILQFATRIAVLTLVVALVGGLLFALFWPGHFSLLKVAMLFYVAAVNLLAHYLVLKAGDQNSSKFVAGFFMAMGIKLLLYLLFLLPAVFFGREKIIPISVTFLSLYFVYTVFEVTQLLKSLKKPPVDLSISK
jgi:hypothetical protein